MDGREVGNGWKIQFAGRLRMILANRLLGNVIGGSLLQFLKPDFTNIPEGGLEMNRLDRTKSWGGVIVIGFLSFFLGCTFDYPVTGVVSMPICDCQAVLKAAQNIMADSGYTVLQSDLERGLISVQREFGDIVKTISFHVGIDKDKGARMLMEVDTSEIIAPPPMGLTRIELINVTKGIAKQMGFSENDVLVQFGEKQRLLSSY